MIKRMISGALALFMALALTVTPVHARESGETTVYVFLRSELGCNAATACGILANIHAESEYNPQAYNPSGGYYGICQWGGERQQRLKNYCSDNGLDYQTLEGQLWYLKYELQGREAEAWKQLQSIENSQQGAYDAAYRFAQYYERCYSGYWDKRGSIAKNTFWPKYKDDNGVYSPSNTPKPTPTVAGFTDVKSDDYFADAVRWAVDRDITSGTSANKFSPYNKCTRAQIVTFLWRAYGSREPAQKDNPFTDVKESDYFYKAVLWAVETGVTEGTSANKFSPGSQVNRAQTVTFLWRAAGKPAADPSGTFEDVPSGRFFTTAVHWAVDRDITEGTSRTTFSPNSPCTRAQIVTFLYRDLK